MESVPLPQRFHVRVTFLFGALTLALLGGMGALSYRWAREAQRSTVAVRLEGLAVAVAAGVDTDRLDTVLAGGPTAHAEHRALVERFASVARDQPDVQSIYVVVPDRPAGWVRFAADWVRTGAPGSIGQRYDARRTPSMLASFERPQIETELHTDEWGSSLSGYAPVRDSSGRAIAVLGVDVSAGSVDGLDRQVLVRVAWVYGTAVLVLVAAGLGLGRSVRRPIQQVIEASGAIVSGQAGARVRSSRRDELGLLAEHFDRMAEGLEERERLRTLFGRYVSEDVARRVLASPEAARLGGEEREVTVMFVDLGGFSRVVELEEPTTTVRMLEEYASAATDAIETHGGCVIEMLGDALLASFGAPEALDDHSARAVRCGLELVSRIEDLGRAWSERGLTAHWAREGIVVRPRVGIHTGLVVAGNTGGRTRMKYAILGDAVNVAARLQSLDASGPVRVSGATWALLPSELAARALPGGSRSVKGRTAEVEVYTFDPSAPDP